MSAGQPEVLTQKIGDILACGDSPVNPLTVYHQRNFKAFLRFYGHVETYSVNCLTTLRSKTRAHTMRAAAL